MGTSTKILVSRTVFPGVVLLLAFLTGCRGGGEFKTAPVRGKVTFQGQAVTGGSLTFRPVATSDATGMLGKPAEANIQPDGTYVASTYEQGDGAVIGRHEVLYSPPPIQYTREPKPGEPPPASPYDGLSVKDNKVEVKRGTNEINLELIRQR